MAVDSPSGMSIILLKYLIDLYMDRREPGHQGFENGAGPFLPCKRCTPQESAPANYRSCSRNTPAVRVKIIRIRMPTIA